MSLWHYAVLKSVRGKRKSPKVVRNNSVNRVWVTTALADMLVFLLASLEPACAQGQPLLHFWPQPFLSALSRNTCTAHSAVEPPYRHIYRTFCFAFTVHYLIWVFLIFFCVIFLQYRQRNSYLFRLSSSRHFFVSSGFCCFSLRLFFFFLVVIVR